jgi:hypothetical protein
MEFLMRIRSFTFRGVLLLIAVTLALPDQPSSAKYAMPDLVNVPVNRLIRNLETLAKENPSDVDVRFNLARVHAMAYALKTDAAQAIKGRESEGAWFGYSPSHVPFEAKPAENKQQLKAARAHLDNAIAVYGEVLTLDPEKLPAALGHAWCIDQSGNKQKAVAEYRQVVRAAWQKEKDMTSAGLRFHPVTAEAATYLIRLLDPEKDKDEIARLRNRIERTSHIPRAITPLVIPLRDGLRPDQLEDTLATVAFDADGAGLRKHWTWITKDAGWLVYNAQPTGEVTSALQMFGSVTFWLFWENGYRALTALDDNRDGRLDGDELQGLAIWRDLNGNGISDPGEVTPVAKWGIVSISCGFERDQNHPDRIAYSPAGVVFRDGSIRPTYDLILHPAQVD